MLRRFVSSFSPRKLCLIADGSLAIRKAAASILRDLRIQVAEAGSGAEAVVKYRQQRPDAILLDGAIASQDGFDFLRELMGGEAAHDRRRPKVILCTAERDPAQITRAFEAGAHEYVIKPFDRVILTAKLESLGLTA